MNMKNNTNDIRNQLIWVLNSNNELEQISIAQYELDHNEKLTKDRIKLLVECSKITQKFIDLRNGALEILSQHEEQKQPSEKLKETKLEPKTITPISQPIKKLEPTKPLSVQKQPTNQDILRQVVTELTNEYLIKTPKEEQYKLTAEFTLIMKMDLTNKTYVGVIGGMTLDQLNAAKAVLFKELNINIH